MVRQGFILFLFCTAVLFFNCKNSAGPTPSDKTSARERVVQVGQDIPYDLNEPENVFSLERDLKEISGLAYSPYSNRLLAINDEKGYIYVLEPASGKIQERIDFGKSNDYEGIAYDDGIIYVVESNGDIAVVDEQNKKRIDKYNTKLSRKNDIEGLTYNPSTSTLLVAAKGMGNLKKKKEDYKSIFSLDPTTQTVSEIPFFKVDLVKAIKTLNASNSTKKVLLTNYQTARAKKFSPSGIAIHPISNQIYVLSSRGKLLTIFNQKGDLEGVYFLDEKMHAQPEGICFGEDLTLYISNEGRAGKAHILTFQTKK